MDVTVVGSGPNGLVAAYVCALAGLRVRVVESDEELGGGARSHSDLETGFVHDKCSSVHPTAAASPIFNAMRLEQDIKYVYPRASYAHVLDEGRAALAYRSLRDTTAEMSGDARRWRQTFDAGSGFGDSVVRASFLTPPLGPVGIPDKLRLALGAAARAAQPFRTIEADALWTGLRAHAPGAPRSIASALVAVSLGTLAHQKGWPFISGGSAQLTDALVKRLTELSVTFALGHTITDFRELSSRAVIYCGSPRGYVQAAGAQMPAKSRKRFERFRYGPSVVKIDATLDGAIPWTDKRLREAGTVHLGGTGPQIVASEQGVAQGQDSEEPFVLVTQASNFDPWRAPLGKGVFYAYAHVSSSAKPVEVSDRIAGLLESHAPGFRSLVRRWRITEPRQLAHQNLNYVDGDICTGEISLRQLVGRPVVAFNPWRGPVSGTYLGSAGTFPGPGTHGMAGWHAARTCLSDLFDRQMTLDLIEELQ
ncbi:phytoene dehydrogenase-like protein [Microbacterium natoriense]|uniref:Phytoene dehydrogenase-like protein n=1 Tax=Microbacterium natoriense TaxID=284570 RepID=A0AAW8EX83_9MICO|nr:NAD(P)/FAD-dependent oxidoreductase [Microbacterium natoriense]MDQ0647264.1 phytoene dehydrogenase-like protein [Microbacterium natoriense]